MPATAPSLPQKTQHRQFTRAVAICALVGLLLLLLFLLPRVLSHLRAGKPAADTTDSQAAADVTASEDTALPPDAETTEAAPPEAAADVPFYLYDARHTTPGGQRINLPERYFWNTDAATLACVSYDRYDEQGRRIARDTYVGSGMDTQADKAALRELGQDDLFGTGVYCRRTHEQWSYDDAVHLVTHETYKQYGEEYALQLILREEAPYEDLSDTELFGRGITPLILWSMTENARQATLWSVEEQADAVWTVTEDGYTVQVTDRDYYGTVYESSYEYAADGSLLRACYVEDGATYLGYLAEYDADGHLLEEYDAMPILQREPLSEIYHDNFYDEALTMPLRPRAYTDCYRRFFYREDGALSYALDIDTLEGSGWLYVLRYDEENRLYATYSYRISGGHLGDFRLELPDGGMLYFLDSYREYMIYEDTGFRFLHGQYAADEISEDTADGSMSWRFLFDEGRPWIRVYDDHSIDWTAPVSPVR